MADAAPDDADEKPAKKKKSKLLLFVALGAVLLIGGGVGGAFALGMFGGEAEADHAEDGDADHGTAADAEHGAADQHAAATADHGDPHGGGHAAGQPLFVDLPDLLVNLVVAEGRPRFLKLSLAVEVDDAAAAERIQQLSPRIVDSFQLFLRTLTPAELQGPGSMFRLKEGLHVRIHQAIEPAQVRDVLFKEMLVQ